jgi:hypothetical protein
MKEYTGSVPKSPTGFGVRSRPKQRHREQGGQALIEFALAVPILFLMLIGVAFIAQGLSLQMTLYGAAYEGARIWAKNPAAADLNHCTPPACDPTAANANNFEKYVVPAVRQYMTNNGFQGDKVIFYTGDATKYNQFVQFYANQQIAVKVILLYPIELPVGNFAGGYQQIIIGASCTLKRGV